MNIKSVLTLPGASEGPIDTPLRSDSRASLHLSSRPRPMTHTPFVPVLLCALALVLVLGWQAFLLLAERGGLQAAHVGQQQTVDNAGKLRVSLDALAADTQRLADTGNASAALLVAELRKRGVTINAQQGAAAAKP